MKLILVGCEYSGTTTLALRINGWLTDLTGAGFRLIHDHWKIPHTSGHLPEDTDNFLTPEEQAQVLALSPKLKEMHQRHSLYYHTPHGATDENSLIIGYHFDDGIYGPLYFEYGRPTDPVDRRMTGPQVEKTMLQNAPETVLVLVKASPDIIRRRLRESPHEKGVLREADIQLVLDRFEEEFKRSLISKKFTLDTSAVTVDDTLAEFVEKVEIHLSEVDRSRLLARQALLKDP
jgi:hypothetical protein